MVFTPLYPLPRLNTFVIDFMTKSISPCSSDAQLGEFRVDCRRGARLWRVQTVHVWSLHVDKLMADVRQ